MLPEHEPNWLEKLLAPIIGPALWILVLVIAFSSVSGCVATSEAESDIARKSLLAKQRQEELAAAQRGEVIFDPTPYYGSEVIAEKGSKNGKALPKGFEGPRGLELNLGSGVGIAEIVDALSEATDLQVKVRTVYALPDGGTIKVPVPGKMRVAYTGALSKFLDQVASRMDLAWEYDGTAITFDRMVTKRYRMPIPNNNSTFNTSVPGLRSSDNGSSVEFTKNSQFDSWAELKAALDAVLPSPAYAKLSKHTGRVTVFALPSMQAQAAGIIEDYQNIFSTRIGLEVGVFFVDTQKADDFGLGLKWAGSNGSVTGAAGALTGNGIFTLSSNGGGVDFKALATHEAVVDHRIRSTIAQSGVVSPILLTRSQNFVTGTTTETAENGTTTSSVDTATIDTGISIHAIPRLISNNQIQLNLTVMQNNLTSLDQFGEGNNAVQLPVVDTRTIQNDSVVSPGETLVFSGYEQEVSTRSQTGTGVANFFGLGGSSSGEVSRVRMILMVRPALIGPRG
jgi:hypothetical protein